MAGNSSGSPADSTLPTAQPGTARRKVRKGTRSCWECKRRKNRCTWSNDEGKCDGCHHRGTKCVGQEFPDDYALSRRRVANRSDQDHIQRLEALVNELSRRIDSGNSRGADQPESLHGHGSGEDISASTTGSRSGTSIPSPEIPLMIGATDVTFNALSNSTSVDGNGRVRTSNISHPSHPRALDGFSSPLQLLSEPTDKSIAPLSRALMAAWPREQHYDAIINSNVGSLHPALSAACSGFQTPPIPKDLLLLPPPGTTPAVIARRLLTLGIYLQVISSQSEYGIRDPSSGHHAVSSRMLETVNRLITHNDTLPESVEIIECLVLESQYHNYTGNVRRAWVVLRRAMAMAQMLGLDRQHKALIHDAAVNENTVTSRQEAIWHLLVHMDQYLSLVLGVSPSLPEYSQTTPSLLQRYTLSDRLTRFHSMAAGRILQRNRVDMYDIIETAKIDKILQEAATCMPAQWWLPPDPYDDFGDEQSFVDRLMVQFAHYNILLQVHLPYMLRSLRDNQDHKCTYTVINASREMLTRFTTFRNRYLTVSYCRGLDIFAFVASIALCLLHIRSSCTDQHQGNGHDAYSSHPIIHQRLTNRGLMERALWNMQKVAIGEPDDATISGIVPLFQRLLTVEAEAHQGVTYNIHTPSDTSKQTICGQRVEIGNDTLDLPIPFCGTVKIEKVCPSQIITAEVVTDSVEVMLPGSFPPYLGTLPTLQLPAGSQHPMATRDDHFKDNQFSITNTYTATVQPELGAQPVLAQEPQPEPEVPAPEIMGSFEDQLQPAIDSDFFEHVWDL